MPGTTATPHSAGPRKMTGTTSPEEFLVPCFLQGQNTVMIFFLYIQELIDTRTVGGSELMEWSFLFSFLSLISGQQDIILAVWPLLGVAASPPPAISCKTESLTGLVSHRSCLWNCSSEVASLCASAPLLLCEFSSAWSMVFVIPSRNVRELGFWMQIKTTMRCYFHFWKVKRIVARTDEEVERPEPSHVAGRHEECAAAEENSLATPKPVQHKANKRPSNSSPSPPVHKCWQQHCS